MSRSTSGAIDFKFSSAALSLACKSSFDVSYCGLFSMSLIASFCLAVCTSSNVRWYPCHSRAWSALSIQTVTASRAIEVSAKTTCTFLTSREYSSVAGIGDQTPPGRRPGPLASDIKKPFGNGDDVLEIKGPPQNHLDRQSRHPEHQVGKHHVADESHPGEELGEVRHAGHDRRQKKEVGKHNREPEPLAAEDVFHLLEAGGPCRRHRQRGMHP